MVQGLNLGQTPDLHELDPELLTLRKPMSHCLAVAGTATGVFLLADVPSAAKRHVALPFRASRSYFCRWSFRKPSIASCIRSRVSRFRGVPRRAWAPAKAATGARAVSLAFSGVAHSLHRVK